MNVPKNPVAKFSRQFNKAKTFKDKKKDYSRKPKHQNRDY